MHELV